MKEKKIQEKEGMKFKEEEKESIEVVTQADEGELLHVKRVLFGFQRMTKEPKENPFHTQEEKAIISIPFVPSKLPRNSPPNKPVQFRPFTFS